MCFPFAGCVYLFGSRHVACRAATARQRLFHCDELSFDFLADDWTGMIMY
jgi:hypothetical protein